eukprot:364796-Chlamydomonas_euryale.AAC.3
MSCCMCGEGGWHVSGGAWAAAAHSVASFKQRPVGACTVKERLKRRQRDPSGVDATQAVAQRRRQA